MKENSVCEEYGMRMLAVFEALPIKNMNYLINEIKDQFAAGRPRESIYDTIIRVLYEKTTLAMMNEADSFFCISDDLVKVPPALELKVQTLINAALDGDAPMSYDQFVQTLQDSGALDNTEPEKMCPIKLAQIVLDKEKEDHKRAKDNVH